MKTAVIVVTVLCAISLVPQPTLATTCPESCEDVSCGPRPQCQYGLVIEVPCLCCIVCGKGPGEFCSYYTTMCGDGLKCKYEAGIMSNGTCVNKTADTQFVQPETRWEGGGFVIMNGAESLTHQHIASFTALSFILVPLLQ